MTFYKTQRPLPGWHFEDCSGWRIIQDIYRGRFMALGIVPDFALDGEEPPDG